MLYPQPFSTEPQRLYCEPSTAPGVSLHSFWRFTLIRIRVWLLTFDADSYAAFHCGANPYPVANFDGDPAPPSQKNDANQVDPDPLHCLLSQIRIQKL